MGIIKFQFFDTKVKMKFAKAMAVASAAATANAFSSDFFQGLQTGIFIMSDDQFGDYSCPDVVISEQIQTYLNMIEPAKMMIQNMNQGKPIPEFEYVSKYSRQFATVISVFG